MIKIFLVFFLIFLLFSCATSSSLKSEKESLIFDTTETVDLKEDEQKETSLSDEDIDNIELEDKDIDESITEDAFLIEGENLKEEQIMIDEEIEEKEEDITSSLEEYEDKKSLFEEDITENNKKDSLFSDDEEETTLLSEEENLPIKIEENEKQNEDIETINDEDKESDIENFKTTETHENEAEEQQETTTELSYDIQSLGEKEYEIKSPSPSETEVDENSKEINTLIIANDEKATLIENEKPIKEEENNIEEIQNTGKPEEESIKEDTKTASQSKISKEETSLVDERQVVPETVQIEALKDEAEDKTQFPKEEETEKNQVLPSRTVSMKNNQYLDITYPGKGWVYLGETSGKQAMRYFGRKITGEDTSFSLRSKEEGKTILHFYKNDPLTGRYIDDYLEVKIEGEAGTEERISAPNYTDFVPEKMKSEEKTQGRSDNIQKAENKSSQTEIFNAEKETSGNSFYETNNEKSNENTDSILSYIDIQKEEEELIESEEIDSETLAAEELLKQARKSFEDEKYSEALSKLNLFLEKSTAGTDEALFLEAQILESPSPERNIKKALENYETIVSRYPQSPYWKRANERAIYLKKFYFNIY